MLREKKNKLPGRETQAYRLLVLIAISGEFPVTLLDRLPGGESYKEAMVYKLKSEKLLRIYYKDKLRTLRLTAYAKKLLLAQRPERFSFYLTGNADTNLLKSEITRRIRLCRIAVTYVTMQGAGISLFRDSKPEIFRPTGEMISEKPKRPVFYSSREIKEIGMEAVKIRGARLVGVTVSENHIFATYNQSITGTRWDYRAEMRAKVLLGNRFCRGSNQYRPETICGLLLDEGMEPLYQLLTGADSATRCFFLLDGNYEHFYYLTNDHYGEVLLKLLCNQDKTEELNTLLMQGLGKREPGWLIENDAVDRQGNPVLFGYFMDMPRMVRFANALQLQERQGTLICFDFQKEVLRRCFGEEMELQTISFEKFERRFCT